VFYFLFSIFDLSFVIGLAASNAMANDKSKMENGKWK